MTVTIPELTIIEHLDFQTHCEMAGCDGLATHIYLSFHKPCFRDCYLCTTCATQLIEAHQRFIKAWPCPRCDKTILIDPPSFRIEPL